MSESNKKKRHGSNFDRERFSIPRVNLWIFLGGIVMIVLGYWALSRPPWNSSVSLNLAPILLVLGYCVVIPLAILYRKRENNKPNTMPDQEKPREVESKMPPTSGTGVEVKAGFFPLAFFLFFCSPRIEIDGKVHEVSWGTHFFDLPPGKHTVKIYFGYLFMPHCGANSVDVVVEEGKTRKVKYWMPPWMLAKGSIRVE